MKRRLLAGAAAITLGIAAIGCAGSNGTNSSSPVAMAASAGFALMPSGNTQQITQSAAIKAAEAAWTPPPGAVINAHSYIATSTSQHGFSTAAVAADPSLSRLEEPLAVKASHTNATVPLLGSGGIGVPVWLVTYTHVDVTGIAGLGERAPHYHAVNTLVDANSGVAFESFTSTGKA